MTEAESFSRALNLWTSLSVIDHELSAERAKAYEVLVEVAYVSSSLVFWQARELRYVQICWKMRNYSSAFAITLGLAATRVRRLTETMKVGSIASLSSVVGTDHGSFSLSLRATTSS